jgi:two-component system, LytTR family, response regulator
MELRFAVVEDRLPDAQRLESLLRLAFGGGQPLVCDHYESGDAFLAAFPSKEYQVIFLDICMEGTNGIETARILRRADPDLLLVFVTSSPEYVWDAFPVHPFDYLLKPYREEKLFQLADELRRVLFRAEPELEVRIARQQVHLPLRKIQYAMAQNHYVRIVSDDGECRAVSTFSQVEQLLRAQENFIVCNRGVILNMDKVLRLDCDCFEMLDDTCLPVRQKDKNSLFAQFTQYQFRHMRREL